MYPYVDFLDLHQVNLYGYEEAKSDLLIEMLINKILIGRKLPPGIVYQINEKTYQLTLLNTMLQDKETYITLNPKSPFEYDGGHKRAIAHYILNKPFPVIVAGKRPFIDVPSEEPIHIKDIIIQDDEDAIVTLYKKALHDPHYHTI